MKKILLIALIATGFFAQVKAQDKLGINAKYTGAQATKKTYKVIYQLDQASPDIIKKAIRNINNLLNDPRLKDKVEVELIAYSGGVDAYRKNSEYEEGIRSLASRGVIIAQCTNTIVERKIDKSELYDFIGYVPSGNGELAIRGAEGWVIIKP